MATTLVIVESPAKAKTIQRFLDDSDALDGDIVVEASVGHVRDLPARAADAPASPKRQWEILDGVFAATATDSSAEGRTFSASLVQIDGAKLASGKDFGDDGVLRGSAVALDQPRAEALATALAADDVSFGVRSVERKPYRRRP